jgi:PPK2 family polyphosphate:nucleotide phosphotransferase
MKKEKGDADPFRDVKPFIEQLQVTKPSRFTLKNYDSELTGGFEPSRGKEILNSGLEHLNELQNRLYAQDQWAILLLFQGMDASGKDGVIRNVLSGLNPQGCHVHPFKSPTSHELDHDFLWRAHLHVPKRGEIGVFNRSYYEEVLIVRVHPEILDGEKLPKKLITPQIWSERLEDIAAFERYLGRNGVIIRKFYLHLSRKEQKKRFMKRLEDPEKHWKFAASDVGERQFWPQYMAAYEQAIAATSTAEAPWFIVPADHKWFSRLFVAAVLSQTLQSLNLKYPEVSKEEQQQMAEARKALESEK